MTNESFQESLKECKTIEEKIQWGIGAMRETLSQKETPRFKEFWELRKLCLDLFKEPINSFSRAKFWEEYVELSSEAKKLRDLLNENHEFAAEQIALAITSLEEELKDFEGSVAKSSEPPFASLSKALKKEPYLPLQKGLELLNGAAVKITSLRKEVIALDLRVGLKHRLFERLSKLGDFVFPKRKELIREISKLFCADIEQYVGDWFTPQVTNKKPLYLLREEIKGLQSVSKALGLNTKAFSETRLKLSECWDKIKVKEKERKVQAQEKKMSIQKNNAPVKKKVSALKEMKIEGEEKLKKEVENLLADLSKAKCEKKIKLAEEIEASTIDSFEKAMLIAQLEKVEEAICIKESKKLDVKESYALWKKRKEHLKEQLEKSKKELGTSGLDFAKAYQLRNLIELQKENLERAEGFIEGLL